MHVRLFWLASLISLPLLSFAQLDTAGRGPDELFEYARQLAAKGRYADARMVARALLQRAPGYHDATVLTARTYGWQRQFDSARVVLRTLLQRSPTVLDAHCALADVELWAQRYDAAVRAADVGLKLYPQNEELLKRKATALGRGVRSKPADNRVALTYSGDFFEQYYGPMHALECVYERQTVRGPLIAHITAGSRFDRNGIQLGADWYPRLTPTVSGFISYAYSGSVLFPDHRIGLEASATVSDQWEASVGGRAFVFEEFAPVWLGTVSGTIYTGRWLISLRPYLTVRGTSSALSGVVSTRYTYGEETEYVFGRIGTGFSADERFIQTSEGFAGKELFFLESQFVGVGAQFPLSGSVDMRIGGDYTKRELGFQAGTFVSMFTLTAGISYRW